MATACKTLGVCLILAALVMWPGPAFDRSAPPPPPPVRLDYHGDPLPPGAITRLGCARLRHASGMLHVTFSPDGKSILTYGRWGVCAWCRKTGKRLDQSRFRLFNVVRWGYFIDGARPRFAAGYKGPGTVAIYDLTTGKYTARFTIPKEAQVLALDSEAKTLAASYQDHTILLFDTKTGKRTHTLRGHKHEIQCLAFSPNGNILASGDYDNPRDRDPRPQPEDEHDGRPHAVRLWDVRTGKELRQLGGHENSVSTVTFTPDGATLAVTGYFPGVRLWDVATGKVLTPLEKKPEVGGRWVTFSPDGKTLVERRSRQLRFWDLKTRRLVRTVQSDSSGWRMPAFSPDGKTLVDLSRDGQEVVLIDVATGKKLEILPGHQRTVLEVVCSRDGKRAVTLSTDNTLRLWNAETGKELRRIAEGLNQAHGLTLTPDDKTVLVVDRSPKTEDKESEDRLRLWDLVNGKELPALARSKLAWASPQLAARRRLLVASLRAGISVRLRSMTTNNEVNLLGENEDASNFAISQEGKMVAIFISRQYRKGTPIVYGIRLCDLTTGKLVAQFPHPHREVNAFFFSNNGKILLVSYEHGLRFFDVTTKQLVRELKGKAWSSMRNLRFTSDDKLMVYLRGVDQYYRAKEFRQPRLMEVLTGKEITALPGHTGPICSLAFTADGSGLFTAGADRTVLVWNLRKLPNLTGGSGVLTAKELTQRWEELDSPDARTAYRAMVRLSGRPRETIEHLRKSFKPAVKRDTRLIRRLIGELDGDTYQARQRAAKQLEAIGELARPELEQAVKRPPSAEVQRAAKSLLNLLAKNQKQRESLRDVRAVQVLEWIATADARAALKVVADGEPLAIRMREAAAALQRLAKRCHSR